MSLTSDNAIDLKEDAYRTVIFNNCAFRGAGSERRIRKFNLSKELINLPRTLRP